MMDDKAKLEATRGLAEFEATSAVESRAKLIDEHNSAFRWMVASLFALNGGAILSLFGNERFGLDATYPAFWTFFGGIVSTFLTVIVAQISDRLMIARMHEWGLYWSQVKITGARVVEAEEDIKSGIARAENWGRRSRQLAIFAMVWFVLGVISSIVVDQESALSKIESEMLLRDDKLDKIERELDRLETVLRKK